MTESDLVLPKIALMESALIPYKPWSQCTNHRNFFVVPSIGWFSW